MLKVYKAAAMGGFRNHWLNSRFHFSFADYYNPDRMGFGPLRVINDDIIGAGQGFGMHPHKDMEIITYVREGVITHRDSLGNEGHTAAGDVQVMSAGTGITHAEMAGREGSTKLFQIWIQPRARNLAPRWEQSVFPKEPVTDRLNLLVSGRAGDNGKNALMINQDAAIYGGKLLKGTQLSHKIGGQAYIVIAEGTVRINGTEMAEGDGAEATGEKTLVIEAGTDSVLLVIEMDVAQRKAA